MHSLTETGANNDDSDSYAKEPLKKRRRKNSVRYSSLLQESMNRNENFLNQEFGKRESCQYCGIEINCDELMLHELNCDFNDMLMVLDSDFLANENQFEFESIPNNCIENNNKFETSHYNFKENNNNINININTNVILKCNQTIENTTKAENKAKNNNNGDISMLRHFEMNNITNNNNNNNNIVIGNDSNKIEMRTNINCKHNYKQYLNSTLKNIENDNNYNNNLEQNVNGSNIESNETLSTKKDTKWNYKRLNVKNLGTKAKKVKKKKNYCNEKKGKRKFKSPKMNFEKIRKLKEKPVKKETGNVIASVCKNDPKYNEALICMFCDKKFAPKDHEKHEMICTGMYVA